VPTEPEVPPARTGVLGDVVDNDVVADTRMRMEAASLAAAAAAGSARNPFPSGSAPGLAAVRKVLDDRAAYRPAVADPALRGTYSWERQAEVLRGVSEDLIQPTD
jgi:hypothetical protein